jgi:hypothetical protein
VGDWPDGTSRTDAEGRFRLDGVPLDEVRVAITGTDHPRAAVRIPASSDSSVLHDVGTIEVADVRRIEGTLVDPAGKPVPQAMLEWVDHTETTIAFAHEGKFLLYVPRPGSTLFVRVRKSSLLSRKGPGVVIEGPFDLRGGRLDLRLPEALKETAAR